MKQLDSIYRNEEVIKKSTFIAIVAPITSVDEAKTFLKDYSQDNVTHNCWAYRVGSVYRFNDDGEPSGTAGMPILKAIEGQGFDNTAALVIRHYGGIKLGTGGLMRAYGGTVNRCLQTAGFNPILAKQQVLLSVPFQYIQSVHNLIKNYQAHMQSETYDEKGALLSIEVLVEDESNFINESINLSKGTIQALNSD